MFDYQGTERLYDLNQVGYEQHLDLMKENPEFPNVI